MENKERSRIDKLIDLSKKYTDLLVELRESTKYESCTHHAVELPERKGYFLLFEIKSQKIVREGAPGKIKSFLNSRNIDTDSVYDYESLGIPEFITREYPSHWASLLINGDASGYEDEDIELINKATEDLGRCVGVSEDSWFQHGHDANRNQGADVSTFTFIKRNKNKK